MAEDTIDTLVDQKKLPKTRSTTETLRLHGYLAQIDPEDPKSTYGSNIGNLMAIIEENQEYASPFSETLPYTFAEVVYACRYEMAEKIEDVLARRTRTLLLDAKQAIALAPKVAEIMAKELNKGPHWIAQELEHFSNIARHYLPH